MRRFIGIAAALALTAFLPAYADEAKPFIDNHVVDLTAILPPPPANNLAETNKEVGEVLMIQVTRTPAMVARAKADDEEDVWRFADVLGAKFDKTALPKTAAFFDRIAATEGAVVDPAKKVFKRPRPYLLNDLVKPVVEPSKSGSWPSGHATVGTMMGIVLANMIPEKRAAIMARAREFGENRVVAGMHYPSDVEAGRVAGSVIAQTIMQIDEFKAEFEASKTELRAALGLSS